MTSVPQPDNRSLDAETGDSPPVPGPRSLPLLVTEIIRQDTGGGDENEGEPPRSAAPTTWLDADWAGPGSSVEDVIDAAAGALAQWPDLIDGPCEVVIALSCDEEVAALNAQFRGMPKPTNVLSFPSASFAADDAGEADGGGLRDGMLIPRKNLGDIILAEETLIREAADLGIPRSHHLQHLVIHGILHLLGFDHDTDVKADRMEKLETSILAGLGVADPYADDTSDEGMIRS